jgi:hypothetical protein
MKHHVDAMCAELGIELDEIVVSGGGATARCSCRSSPTCSASRLAPDRRRGSGARLGHLRRRRRGRAPRLRHRGRTNDHWPRSFAPARRARRGVRPHGRHRVPRRPHRTPMRCSSAPTRSSTDRDPPPPGGTTMSLTRAEIVEAPAAPARRRPGDHRRRDAHALQRRQLPQAAEHLRRAHDAQAGGRGDGAPVPTTSRRCSRSPTPTASTWWPAPAAPPPRAGSRAGWRTSIVVDGSR